jgi:XTP/dITP diphosphohydrolase
MKLPNLMFATANAHKVEEVASILGYKPQMPPTALLEQTPEETGLSFEENAEIKARFIFEKTGIPTFAEDSGLCVDALDGAPGIFSARFAGKQANAADNNALLLKKMEGIEDRTARFVAVICLVGPGFCHFFRGEVEGTIAKDLDGINGFGYDPVFIPLHFTQSFALLGPDIKHQISHRKKALLAMESFLSHQDI